MAGGASLYPLPAENLRSILDQVSDGVFVVNSDRRIVEFNRAAARLTGFTRREALGKTCTDVLNNRACGRLCHITRSQECAIRRTLETRRPISSEDISVHTQEGHHRVFSLSTTALPGAGEGPAGVAVVFKDVTELRRLHNELKGRYELHNLIGKSHRMQEVYRLIEQAAESDAAVLLEGETGTGKDLVARTIHHLSHRVGHPFVHVSCSALPETLMESELFGHVKGAFTGAVRDKIGRLQAADGGTLLLDEIGEVSPLIQVKLLRFTEGKELERVGDTKTIRVDARIISATNRDLRQLVNEGGFREDLYYRLRVLPIYLPPLRERKGDLTLLIDHFVRRFRTSTDKPVEGPEELALAAMLDYPWPGNIRELEHAVEHAFVSCRGERFTLSDLPVDIRRPEAAERSVLRRSAFAGRRRAPEAAPLDPDRERESILRVLRVAGGNREKAADLLGIGRTTLWRRMKRLGIKPPQEAQDTGGS